MKPTKNHLFCIGCKRPKMLFESKAKADNFIKFNSEEIAATARKAPTRSYYCSFCCGWHITSVSEEARAKQNDERDEKLWNQIHASGRTKLPPTEVGADITASLVKIDQLFSKCQSAIWRTDLCEARELFKDITLEFLLAKQKSNSLKATFTAVERRRLKITTFKNAFDVIDDLSDDKEARTKYLEEHSSPKSATLASRYYENLAFLDSIHVLYLLAKDAAEDGNREEIVRLQQKIADEFKASRCIGLSKKRKYYENLFEELLGQPVMLKKTKTEVEAERKNFLNIIKLVEDAYKAFNNDNDRMATSLIKTAECLIPGNGDETEQILLSHIATLRGRLSAS